MWLVCYYFFQRQQLSWVGFDKGNVMSKSLTKMTRTHVKNSAKTVIMSLNWHVWKLSFSWLKWIHIFMEMNHENSAEMFKQLFVCSSPPCHPKWAARTSHYSWFRSYFIRLQSHFPINDKYDLIVKCDFLVVCNKTVRLYR